MRSIGMWVVLLSLCIVANAAAQLQEKTLKFGDEEVTAEDIERMRGMSLEDLIRSARDLMNDEKAAEAVPFVAVADDRAPEHPDVKTLRADLALSRRDIREARKLYLEAQRANPNDFYANFGLGRVHLLTRQFKQAEIYLEQAEQRAPAELRSEVLVLLAEAYRGLKKTIKATDTAQRAVEADPESFEARYGYVMALTDAEDYSHATTEAEALKRIVQDQISADPSDRSALQRLRTALEAHLIALRRSFQDLVVIGPGGRATDEVPEQNRPRAAAINMKVAELMLMQEEAARQMTLHDMLVFIEQAIEYAPDNADYLRDYGLILLDTGQVTRAREAFTKVLTLRPDDEAALSRLELLGGPVELSPDEPNAPTDDGDAEGTLEEAPEQAAPAAAP